MGIGFSGSGGGGSENETTIRAYMSTDISSNGHIDGYIPFEGITPGGIYADEYDEFELGNHPSLLKEDSGVFTSREPAAFYFTYEVDYAVAVQSVGNFVYRDAAIEVDDSLGYKVGEITSSAQDQPTTALDSYTVQIEGILPVYEDQEVRFFFSLEDEFSDSDREGINEAEIRDVEVSIYHMGP